MHRKQWSFRSWVMVAVGALVMVAGACAQSPSPAAPPGTDPAEAQLAALLAKSPGKIWSVCDVSPPATVPVIGVFGELGAGTLADAPNTAKAFVTAYGKVLGFPDGPALGGDVKVFRDVTDDFGRFIAYCPAEGEKTFFLPGMVVFVFKPDGKLVAAIGRYAPKGAAPAAAMTPAQAVQKAREHIKEKFPEERDAVTGDGEVEQFLSYNPVAEAVGAAPGETMRFFMVTLRLGTPPIPKRVLMTADQGIAMAVEDARLMANSAHVFDVDPSSAYKTQTRDLDDLVDPGFWPYWKINGAHFKVDPRITPGIERAEAWTGWFNDDPLSPTSPNPALCEEMVYYHCQESRKKARAWGGTKDLEKHDPMYFNHWQVAKCDSFPEGDKRKACECFKTSNAWFDPADTSLNFSSDNRRIGKRHPAYDATAICHEYGHFVHKLLSEHWILGIFNKSEMLQAKGVAEAFADLFACSVLDTGKVGKWLLSDVESCGSDAPGSDGSRDLERVKTVSDVSRTNDEHIVGLAFGTGIWKLRTDGTLGKDELMKTLIAGMRLCPLPCRLRNAALAFMAADQALSATPHTAKIGDMFKAQQIFDNVQTAGAP